MIKYLIEKEFKQILRNPFVPKFVIVMPLMMMILMPWAANQEVKNINVSICDSDCSVLSDRLVRKIDASKYLNLTDVSTTNEEALGAIESGVADMIVDIPLDFEKGIVTGQTVQTLISVNSVNGTKAKIGASYLVQILNDFGRELQQEHGESSLPQIPSFKVVQQYKFNPGLDYKVFMIPALMVMLLTLFSGFLPALNIVSEKESGTIEQINVTPVRRLDFIIAKLVPYWVIGFFVLTICMIFASLVYSLVPSGSLLTIYLFASVYVLLVSGMGLVISNYSDTMQQAMFVMFFFLMIFLLMSGLFTPVSGMPTWAQAITVLNPLKYFIFVMRSVYLKGSGFVELLPQFFALCGFALTLNLWAILSYKKRG